MAGVAGGWGGQHMCACVARTFMVQRWERVQESNILHVDMEVGGCMCRSTEIQWNDASACPAGMQRTRCHASHGMPRQQHRTPSRRPCWEHVA